MALKFEDPKVGDIVKTADGCSHELRVHSIVKPHNEPWSYAKLVSLKDGKFVIMHRLGDLRIVQSVPQS